MFGYFNKYVVGDKLLVRYIQPSGVTDELWKELTDWRDNMWAVLNEKTVEYFEVVEQYLIDDKYTQKFGPCVTVRANKNVGVRFEQWVFPEFWFYKPKNGAENKEEYRKDMFGFNTNDDCWSDRKKWLI